MVPGERPLEALAFFRENSGFWSDTSTSRTLLHLRSDGGEDLFEVSRRFREAGQLRVTIWELENGGSCHAILRR